MKQFFRSLTFKIGSVIILIEIIALSAAGVVYAKRFYEQIDRRIETNIQLPGRLMQSGLIRLISLANTKALAALIGEEVVTSVLLDEDRSVILSTESGYTGKDLSELPGVDEAWFDFESAEPVLRHVVGDDGDHYLVSVTPISKPVVEDEPGYYYFYVKTNTNEAAAEKASLVRMLFFGATATVVGTSIVIIFSFNSIILRRIRGLLDVFRRAESGDLSARVEGNIAADELGDLQAGVNSMIARVETLVETASQNEARYRLLAENSVDMIARTDQEGRYLYVSPASRTILGYEPDELLGRSYEEFVHPDDLADLPRFTGQKITKRYRFLHKDGHYVWMETAVRPLNGFGESREYISVARDITERIEVEAEMQEMQAEIIETQRRTIQEISTPVIPLSRRIIAMPLVGEIDAVRAQNIMRALLNGISQNRAKVVILDVTGVPFVDTEVANYLHKAIQAARLKGATTLVTGLSDAVAETVADLGIDWGAETLRNLESGLMMAMEMQGVRLV